MPASKAAKHKESNKHRFLTFSERLANISINAVHRIKRVEPEDEEDSKFCSAILKWRDLDRSLHFQEFLKDIGNKSQNFRMVVHYKDHIFSTLLKHIGVTDSLALQGLCELVVALCMDLRSDFYPYFIDIFKCLTKLLATKDVERLEWIFSALSLLFKHLWRYMVSDIGSILLCYRDLICGEHPAHVEDFAAESISFLMRKACNQDDFFKQLFTLYAGNDNSMGETVGRLLFYLMKGVNGTLYSRTELIMPNLLLCLDDSSLDSVTIFNCVSSAVSLLAKHVKKSHSIMMWDCLVLYLNNACKTLDTVDHAVKLMNTWCSQGGGVLISNPESLLNIMEKLCRKHAETNGKEILNLSVTLILARSDNFAYLYKERIVNMIVSSKDFKDDLVLEFWQSTLKFVNGNSNARKLMLTFCQAKICNNHQGIVYLLLNFILDNSVLPSDAKELLEFQPFKIDYALISRERNTKKIQSYLEEIVRNSESDCALVWSSLLLIGHISPISYAPISMLMDVFASWQSRFKIGKDITAKIFAIFRMILQTGCMVHMKNGNKNKAELSDLCIAFLEFFAENSLEEFFCDPNVLYIFDILCMFGSDLTGKLRNISNITSNLITNLSSHDNLVRKFSLRVLISLFPEESIFQTCLRVEETPATIQTFRDKALRLGEIKYSPDLSTQVSEAILRFLLSNFYINFSSYWPYVSKKITAFLPDDFKSPLYILLFEILDCASNKVESLQSQESGTMEDSPKQSLVEIFQENGVKIPFTLQANNKPDHVNFRFLLWSLLTSNHFNELVENKNRHLVSLFLRFLENEYYKIDKSFAISQNLTQSGSTIASKTLYPVGKKQCIKMLITCLHVLAKFNNPKGIFKCKTLKSLYENLLMHGDVEVQKSALKCLLKFKNRTLVEFAGQLDALLDDDKIRETMVQFNLSEVKDGEREHFVPVLFRLMYGRIVSKSGVGVQNRKRRATVLRFLSSLKINEMEEFIFLAIDPVKHYVEESKITEPLDEKFVIGSDITDVVPLSKQNGILGTQMALIEKHPDLLSHRMFHYLLKLLLSLHRSYFIMINKIESSDCQLGSAGTTTFLRNLAKQAHNIINSLISSWPDALTLSNSEIKSIYFVLVMPHLHKMHHECVSQPTPLLNLFNEFSKKPKFVPLLGNKMKNSDTPMDAIVSTLVAEKTSPAVSKFIIEILLRLLGDEIEEEAGDLELVQDTLSNVTLDVFDLLAIDASNIGLKLMVNQVTNILKYFIIKLKSNSGSGLMQSHLKILIALGGHVTDVNLSNELVELLLSHISNSARAGRNIGQSAEAKLILPALESLAALPVSCGFVRSISRLFSRISSRECRICIKEIFERAFLEIPRSDNSNAVKLVSIINDINAWDKRFIEELDYDSRLAGFQELNEWLESDDIWLLDDNFSGLMPIVHNCIFTLANHSGDLSLREMSSRSLELIIMLVFKHSEEQEYCGLYDAVISSTILKSLRRGLNSDEENQRHEWMRLLVKIAKLAPSTNTFSHFTALCNDKDPDADFFQNVQHIQMHRRTRAFKKLAKLIVSYGENDNSSANAIQISHTLLYTYLLPLASQTLKCQDLSSLQHLRDACVEVVAACAYVMPWGPYIKFLRYHMTTMMKHPHGVKMVCSILNAFHFEIASISEEKAVELENSYIVMKTEKHKRVDETSTEENALDLKEEKNKTDELESIYVTMICDVLPRLCSTLSTKLDSDSSHKLADSLNFSDIDQCTLRAPLAVAVVALLKRLPSRVMTVHLSTVILKIVGFLRHHYSEVRSAAAKVIVEIVELLEPTRLPIILKEMKHGLIRGYQKHVLIHTVNSILAKIEKSLKVGDLEPSSKLLLSMVMDDLFGKGEEERDVDKIKSKTPEARGRSKSYNIFRIYSKFSRKASILAAITPMKNILDSTHDHKKRKIVESVLIEISMGLQENAGLSAEDIMIFCHGLLTENMPGIFNDKNSFKSSQNKKKDFRPESCYLLSTEPERYGVKETKKTQKSYLHLFIEFSLRFLNSSLKQQVVDIGKPEHQQLLDPFVVILKQCLDSAHSKTITEAIRCLTKFLKANLPSLIENAVEIIKALFKILRENSRGSASNELAQATYRALSILCKTELGAKLSETQLRVLLGYAEEMLYDTERQSHAFNVIQSVIGRGLECDEVNEVMSKVRSISIQTHDMAAMTHARQVYMFFLTHYPLTKVKLTRQLEFVLAQLSFEYESGRLSALELVASLLNSLPEYMVKANCGTIFIALSTMLLNDESVKCKKLSAHVLKILLNSLPVEERDHLFSLVMQWFVDKDHPLHQQLAAIVISVFTEAEGDNFTRFLSGLIPAVVKVMNSLVDGLDEQENISSDESRSNDQFVFQQLSAVRAILQTCQIATDLSWEEDMTSILRCVENLLLHPHSWVRIASSQIFGLVFASLEPTEIIHTAHTRKKSFYFHNCRNTMSLLGIKFCRQIQSAILDENLSEQCAKNLLFIVRTLHALQEQLETEVNTMHCNSSNDCDDEETIQKKTPAKSMLYKMLKAAKLEAANDIKDTSRRSLVLKLFAALTISVKQIEDYLPIIMELIYRETERKIVEEDATASALKKLANEVLEVVKTNVGVTCFMKVYNDVRKQVTLKRRSRKRKRDVERITDPQQEAKAKQRRQEKKKELRKRKIARARPEYGIQFKKRKAQ